MANLREQALPAAVEFIRGEEMRSTAEIGLISELAEAQAVFVRGGVMEDDTSWFWFPASVAPETDSIDLLDGSGPRTLLLAGRIQHGEHGQTFESAFPAPDTRPVNWQELEMPAFFSGKIELAILDDGRVFMPMKYDRPHMLETALSLNIYSLINPE